MWRRWVIVATGLGVACGANNVRPKTPPRADAVLDTISADPALIIDSLAVLASQRGLEIARLSAAEGYLETKWFDLGSRRSGGKYSRHAERVIRIRIYADPTGDRRAVLRSEAVYRRSLDPSVPEGVLEEMVPIDHPGDSVLQALLQEIRPAPAVVGS